MANLLVIDDSPTTHAFLRARLAGSGHVVSALGSFVELPSILADKPPDLVVLDLHMPAMSGKSVAGFIRRHQSSNVPILIYSSQPAAELEAAGRELSAAATVAKSADPSELLRAIRSVLLRSAVASGALAE